MNQNHIIIGAGFSGLSVAHFLKKQNPAAQILLLEKSDRVGGAIQSFQKDGFVAEWGAHGFLDNCVETNELLADLDLTDKALRAPLKNFSRYICLRGRLRKIPQSPLSVLFSNILAPWNKLRVLADLWKKPIESEQTIADWIAHRFGSALLPFADAVATGTYAGAIEKLSIDAVMPKLRGIEKTHGSVIRGLIKSRKQKQPGSLLPSMVSFPTGMHVLCDELAKGKQIIFNSHVAQIKKDQAGWIVTTPQKEFHAESVIIALPVNAALKILSPLLTPPIEKMPEARLVNVVLGFEASISVPHAFGYLSPEVEKRFSLGTLFSSRMFECRAPHGMTILETLVGGRRHPERCDLSDPELIEGALTDLRDLVHIKSEPLFAHVLRPSGGIPQLELGHHQLWKYKESLAAQFDSLHVLGFGWHGIGINDMAKETKRVVDHVCGQNVIAAESLKKVYF